MGVMHVLRPRCGLPRGLLGTRQGSALAPLQVRPLYLWSSRLGFMIKVPERGFVIRSKVTRLNPKLRTINPKSEPGRV